MWKEYNNCGLDIHCVNCGSKSFCKSWAEYVKKHANVKGYAHFDQRVSLAMPSVRNYVLDREKIAKHGFYPFIHFEKKARRYGKKGPQKPRQLYYCAHLDRCIYQRYAFLINCHYDIYAKNHNIDKVAVAYRKSQDNRGLARRAFNAIARFQKCFVIIGDFTDFFDRINHDYLKARLCAVLDQEFLEPDYFAIFRNITRFASWEWSDLVKSSGETAPDPAIHRKINAKAQILTKGQFAENRKNIRKNTTGVGIPQGSPISPILSNVYMSDMDSSLMEYSGRKNGFYMRFSDDFIIILPYETDSEAESFREYLLSFFESRKDIVDLQEEKTHFYVYRNGKLYKDNKESHIDYLGFLFDGRNIRLRPRSLTKYYYRMRRKARTIGRMNWHSPYGRRITAKNIYNIYAKNDTHRPTFINYIKKAKSDVGLNDPAVDALIKCHKQKIATAIKEFLPLQEN